MSQAVVVSLTPSRDSGARYHNVPASDLPGNETHKWVQCMERLVVSVVHFLVPLCPDPVRLGRLMPGIKSVIGGWLEKWLSLSVGLNVGLSLSFVFVFVFVLVTWHVFR